MLGPHERVAALHPLVTLPDPAVGAARLGSGGYFALAGDPAVTDLVAALGGRGLQIPPEAEGGVPRCRLLSSQPPGRAPRPSQRMAASVGIPLEAFLPLAQGALDDVSRLGPAAALTGPVARGDLTTIERHRRVLDPAELGGYDAGVELARRLVTSGREK